MLSRTRIFRPHIFLLVTGSYQSARFRGKTTPQTSDSMTEGHSRVAVAAVDDDESILRSLEYLLESADYPVRVFTSGAALLESGCLAEIGCLISDIDMPGMDGFELLRLVNAARPQLPTILLTG